MARNPKSQVGLRGPVEHDIRNQIIAAATEHFRQYGYSKTTMTDLAGAIGFSKAYIYKFFASKRAIGDVISSYAIDQIAASADANIDAVASASDKIRQLFRSVTRSSLRLLREDRRLYDIVTQAVVENWSCNRLLDDRIEEKLRAIILTARASGEFERKTPLDEACRAIAGSLRAYTHPLMLAQDPDGAAKTEDEVIGMVLRSLAEASPRSVIGNGPLL